MKGRSGLPQEVRIIGGTLKRSKLPVLDVSGLRPTPDRVRETLFNWLSHDFSGWRCLDAFAGSGALGFEAASRGAIQVVLLEKNAKVASQLKESQQRLKAQAVKVETADALAYMKRTPDDAYELIFIDPPFHTEIFVAALTEAARLVVQGGFIYFEAGQAFDAGAAAAMNLTLYRSGRAGSVHFHLLQKISSTGSAE